MDTVIVCTDYYNGFVEAINHHTKSVKLDDDPTIHVVRITLKSTGNGPKLPLSLEPEEGGGRISPIMKAKETAVIPPQT